MTETDKGAKAEEKKISKRKVFEMDGLIVSAAGILPYYKDKILVVEREDETFEVFGGKIEHIDTNVKQAAIRECKEESNGLIVPTEDELKHYYISTKYCVFLYPLCEEIEASRFGTVETFTNEKRVVKYYTLQELKERKTFKVDKKALYDLFERLKK